MGIKERIIDGAFESVSSAYAEAIGKKFWRAHKSPKIMAACEEFVRLQFVLSSSTVRLMQEALALYGRDWCKETFGKPYPPFAVVIGERCRKRLISNHRPKVVQSVELTKLQGEDIAKNLVNLMGWAGALEVVEAGWPKDVRLRTFVLTSIKGIPHE